MASFARVSVEDLKKFSESVKNFNTRINSSLNQLALDTNTLRSNVDETTIVPMEKAVKAISDIIGNAGPQLKTLASQAELYANKVAQIEAQMASKQ